MPQRETDSINGGSLMLDIGLSVFDVPSLLSLQ